MSRLNEWLEEDHAILVDAASDALGTTPEGRRSVRPTVERFYKSLIETVETLDASPLNLMLQDWIKDRSAPTDGEFERFMPVLLKLRQVTADLAVERKASSQALSLIVHLNKVMDDAATFLGEQEIDAALADVSKELESAQSELKKLDKSKSDFISVAAHELKTPLTLIEGYANMLREEFPANDFPRVSVMLGGIANGTTRLREIIDDMIDVSLIDMDILELHLQPVWLNRLVDIVVAELEPAAKARELSIDVQDFEDKNKPVLGDPERLHQVFRNIIVNAIKFTPDGGTVTIRVRSLPEFFDVQIEDTGIGIDPDDMDRVFERFAPIGDVALHSSSKTKFKGGGPGLGLAIARGIVEAHGGNVWAESEGYDEEKYPGTTFHVLVPTQSLSDMEGVEGDEEALEALLKASQGTSNGDDDAP